MNLPAPHEYNRDIMLCKQILQGGRTIAVYKCLIGVAGSIKAAVFLSQLVYWTQRGTDIVGSDGWIHKSVEQMHGETGLSKREQGTCKQKLLESGLIETRYKRYGFGKGRLELRIRLDALAKAVCTANGAETPDISLTDFRQPSNLFFLRYFKERIAYHRDLVDLTGCIHSAIMLSFIMQQCIAKGGMDNDSDRWFVSFNIQGWQKYLFLPYKTQKTARDRLKAHDFIIEKHFFASRRIFTLLNGKAIWSALKNRSRLPKPPENATVQDTNPAGTFSEHTGNKRANTEGTFSEYTRYRRVNTVVPFWKNIGYKRVNTQVTKGRIHTLQNGELTGDKTANTQGTKGRILEDINYSEFSEENNYNKDNNVVGVFDGLIYPKTWGQSMQGKSREIFTRLHPEANKEQLQEILDEIAGQTKPITSPLGLLTVLCRKAAIGELICVLAPIVRERREQQAIWEAERLRAEQRFLQSPDKPETPVETSNSEVYQKVKDSMKAALKKAGAKASW
ncbi:hypothetical protein BG910_11080 [Neisseria chenwenguii]|uniref:Replication protein n=1 Tax=Neisseria chenwenguii TaxID=1853278 RepID=A0A220S3X4_9NEIS|nr:hypothetical protein [Neisseria chenwenguii]ASK28201.1 hypothetical protein BG910_11080 [Neisseria chenwenguii]